MQILDYGKKYYQRQFCPQVTKSKNYTVWFIVLMIILIAYGLLFINQLITFHKLLHDDKKDAQQKQKQKQQKKSTPEYKIYNIEIECSNGGYTLKHSSRLKLMFVCIMSFFNMIFPFALILIISKYFLLENSDVTDIKNDVLVELLPYLIYIFCIFMLIITTVIVKKIILKYTRKFDDDQNKKQTIKKKLFAAIMVCIACIPHIALFFYLMKYDRFFLLGIYLLLNIPMFMHNIASTVFTQSRLIIKIYRNTILVVAFVIFYINYVMKYINSPVLFVALLFFVIISRFLFFRLYSLMINSML